VSSTQIVSVDFKALKIMNSGPPLELPIYEGGLDVIYRSEGWTDDVKVGREDENWILVDDAEEYQ
jgi:hypothetical protein